MGTSIIIPTKNEKNSIEQVIRRIKSLGNYEILVVDKSNDNTPEIAETLGVKVIKQKHDGKGNAMLLGAKNSKENIIFVDGDLSYDLKKIPRIIELSQEYDIVRAFRKPLNIGGPVRFLFNIFMSFLAWIIYGKRTRDLFTGLFSIKKDIFLDMDIKSQGFGIETEIFVKAAKKDLKMVEIPSNYFPRKGQSKVRFVDSARIIITFFKNLAY